MLTVEITRSEMISVEDVLGAADGYEVVAAIGDDLQPWLEIPAEGPHGAVQVGMGSSAAVDTSEGVAAKDFNTGRGSAPAREGTLPGGMRLYGPDSWRLSRFWLRLSRRGW